MDVFRERGDFCCRRVLETTGGKMDFRKEMTIGK